MTNLIRLAALLWVAPPAWAQLTLTETRTVVVDLDVFEGGNGLNANFDLLELPGTQIDAEFNGTARLETCRSFTAPFALDSYNAYGILDVYTSGSYRGFGTPGWSEGSIPGGTLIEFEDDGPTTPTQLDLGSDPIVRVTRPFPVDDEIYATSSGSFIGGYFERYAIRLRGTVDVTWSPDRMADTPVCQGAGTVEAYGDADDLYLRARGVEANALGLFVVGRSPFAGGALCVADATRLLGTIGVADAAGEYVARAELAPVAAGTTWVLQHVYRSATGSSGFQASGAVSITF